MRSPQKSSALDRLRAEVPELSEMCVLILDRESCECLALGAVNSRAQLKAAQCIAALEPLKEKTAV